MSTNKRAHYKWCTVPKCTNTTKKTPDKIFVRLPGNAEKRKRWLRAMHRSEDSIGEKSGGFVCEDHFDLEADAENLIQFRMMGGLLRIKPDVCPHFFHCQQPEKRPALAKYPRMAFLKRRRLEALQEALQGYDDATSSNENPSCTSAQSTIFEKVCSNRLEPSNCESALKTTSNNGAVPSPQLDTRTHALKVHEEMESLPIPSNGDHILRRIKLEPAEEDEHPSKSYSDNDTASTLPLQIVPNAPSSIPWSISEVGNLQLPVQWVACNMPNCADKVIAHINKDIEVDKSIRFTSSGDYEVKFRKTIYKIPLAWFRTLDDANNLLNNIHQAKICEGSGNGQRFSENCLGACDSPMHSRCSACCTEEEIQTQKAGEDVLRQTQRTYGRLKKLILGQDSQQTEVHAVPKEVIKLSDSNQASCDRGENQLQEDCPSLTMHDVRQFPDDTTLACELTAPANRKDSTPRKDSGTCSERDTDGHPTEADATRTIDHIGLKPVEPDERKLEGGPPPSLKQEKLPELTSRGKDLVDSLLKIKVEQIECLPDID